MKHILRLELLPPRCFIANRRVHHGLLGLALMLHDWHDHRVWIRDLIKHP
jgi:hypothetical protein